MSQAERVTRLADLPEHRRDALLWHFAYEGTYGGLDYEGVDDLVQERSSRLCLPANRAVETVPAFTAALGTDGRYHLCRENVPVCGGTRRRSDAAIGYRHELRHHWWVSLSGYHARASEAAAARRHERIVGWVVQLVGEHIDPVQVRGRQRCPIRAEWPSYQGPDTPLGRLRAVLAEALGPLCHTCGRRPGTSVDHDHLSNRVRGLLCLPCNNQVDLCVHASGCAFGTCQDQ